MLDPAKKTWRRFAADQSGIAMTEYLILLGLFTTAVIVAVILVGGDLNAAWSSWAEWLSPSEGNLASPG